MKTQTSTYNSRKFWYRWIGLCLLIFCLPLIGMMSNPTEVHWTLFDFAAAAALLFLLGISLDQIQQKISTQRLRIFSIVAVILLAACLWVELAVGLF